MTRCTPLTLTGVGDTSTVVVDGSSGSPTTVNQFVWASATGPSRPAASSVPVSSVLFMCVVARALGARQSWTINQHNAAL